MASSNFPAWFYGPEGQAEIFNHEAEVPDGWKDSPAAFEKKEAKTVAKAVGETTAPATKPATKEPDKEPTSSGNEPAKKEPEKEPAKAQ